MELYTLPGAGVAQSVYRLSYGLDDGRLLQAGAVMGIFLFTTASRQSLGPTQPLIQRVPGAFTPGVKRPSREGDRLHQVPRLRMRGAIPLLFNTSSRRSA